MKEETEYEMYKRQAAYIKYKQLFNSELVVIVREVLESVENLEHYSFQDSAEHNKLVDYFNKYALHKLLSEDQFIHHYNKEHGK